MRYEWNRSCWFLRKSFVAVITGTSSICTLLKLVACWVVEKYVFIIFFVIPVFCICSCIFVAPMGVLKWNFHLAPRLEIKKCTRDFIVVNIACWLRKTFVQVARRVMKYRGCRICRLFLIRRRCPYEIAFEENLALEEHPEKRTFSIFYFYAVTNGLLS